MDEAQRRQIFAVYEQSHPVAFAYLRESFLWQIANFVCLSIVAGHTVAFALGAITLSVLLVSGGVFLGLGVMTLWLSFSTQRQAIASMREIATSVSGEQHSERPAGYDQQHGKPED